MPLPNVTPTETNAEIAISITLPEAKVTITLPLYIELVPTNKVRDITVVAILVPLLRTATVNVVPTATETFV